MVWTRNDPKDGTPRYIKKFGSIVFVTKDKKNALEHVPEGWEVVNNQHGHLIVKKK